MGERTLYGVVESGLCTVFARVCISYQASVAPLCMRWADGEENGERERKGETGNGRDYIHLQLIELTQQNRTPCLQLWDDNEV